PRLAWRIPAVLDKTLTAPHRFAMVTIEDARDLWLRRDPLLVQLFGAGGLGRGDLNSGAAGAWQPGGEPDAVARRIQESVAGVNVTIPGEVSRLLKESTAFFSALLLGIGGLGVGVGGGARADPRLRHHARAGGARPAPAARGPGRGARREPHRRRGGRRDRARHRL